MRIWIRILSLVGAFFAPVMAVADTLADSMTFAYRNSGVIEQNRALLRAADEDVAMAVAALRPILSWSATAGYRYTESTATIAGQSRRVSQEIAAMNVELTASLTLYDFGRGQLAIAAAKEQVLATRQTLLSVEQDILLRAVQAHMGVIRAQDILALRQSNQRLITRELRAAEDRFDLGEITRTDVDFAKARLASAQAQLAAAEGDLVAASEAYRAVTGRAPSRLTTPAPAQVTRNSDTARDYALRHHPQAVGQRHSVAAAELNIKRAEAASKPTVQLQGKMGLDHDLNYSDQIGISIGGPIYQGGALASQVRQAMARRDAARAGLHQVSAGLSQQVGNAYAQLAVTGQMIESAGRQVRAARAAYRGLQEEANLGTRTTLDVLSSEQSLLDAQVGEVSARIDRVLASYNVLASMGVLTAKHLDLPVQIYDPNTYYSLAEQAPRRSSEQGQALDRILRSIGD